MSENLLTPYLFVYGTLKKGYSNHRLLLREPVAIATIIGDIYHMGAFPAAVRIGYPSAGSIRGEVYRVSAEDLARIDRLEGYVAGGHNNMYERVTTVAEIESASEELVGRDLDELLVYTYEWSDPMLSIQMRERVRGVDWHPKDGKTAR